MIDNEPGLTEELYVNMIGRYAAAVEVLTKRITVRDQRIAELEGKMAEITASLANTPEEK